jgi:hypothetical protein
LKTKIEYQEIGQFMMTAPLRPALGWRSEIKL